MLANWASEVNGSSDVVPEVFEVLNELYDRAFKAQPRWSRAVGAARWGSWSYEGALIVSSLTQRLVQLCHLWMVPARRLGLMAERRQERLNEEVTEQD